MSYEVLLYHTLKMLYTSSLFCPFRDGRSSGAALEKLCVSKESQSLACMYSLCKPHHKTAGVLTRLLDDTRIN